ncbi:hypothetical protein K435DRAFT_706101, partial [Dendrothele bispora CBS 962.96]
EEILIDFRELIGEHSGVNMADAVWERLWSYGIHTKAYKILQIMAFVMDNATNNDTMIQAFEQKCQDHNIEFSAKNSRLRCMPHTFHLAALKVNTH